MDITKLIKVIDSTGDEVSAEVKGTEVGKDDEGNTIVETETKDGDKSTITLDEDNNPVDTIKDSEDNESEIKMIWHGEWADPELTDGTRTVNYWDVEDDLWDKFRADGGEDDMAAFHDWRSAHPEEVKASFDNVADAMGDAALSKGEKDPFSSEDDEIEDSVKVKDSDFTDYDTNCVKVKIEGNNNIEYMDSQEFAEFRKACKKDGTKYEVIKDSADFGVEAQKVLGTNASPKVFSKDGYDIAEFKFEPDDIDKAIELCEQAGVDYRVAKSGPSGKEPNGVFYVIKKVKDSADDNRAAEFCITEDNVYDLIEKGKTNVAIPSGSDTKAFVAAVEDILADVAKDCGYGKLAVNTEIEGNMLNIIKK